MTTMRAATGLLVALFVLAPALWARGAPPAAAGRGSGGVIVVDQAHRQAFTVDRQGPLQLSRFARVLTDAGAEVRSSRAPLDAGVLDGAAALVISGPFEPLSPAELDAVETFLARGGRLAVMLHVGAAVASLGFRLGVSISNGVVRDPAAMVGSDPTDFRARAVGAPHPVLAGVERFSLYGAWALLPRGRGTRSLAVTSAQAWVDLNRNQRKDAQDAVQTFSVALAGSRGEGRFVFFGDDAVFQNKFLQGDNRRLAHNLARWLLARR